MLGTGIGADPEVSRPGDPGKIILWLFFREVFFQVVLQYLKTEQRETSGLYLVSSGHVTEVLCGKH